MMSRALQSWTVISTVIVAVSLLTGCSHVNRQRTSSLQEYLYPKDTKTEEVRSASPKLSPPLHMGIVFVPETHRVMTGAPLPSTSFGMAEPLSALRSTSFGTAEPLSEKDKTELAQEISSLLGKDPFFKSIEIIPSTYLSKGGSFANLDQVRTMTSVDVVALLSYDQVQFTDEGWVTSLYWITLGAGVWFVPGEKNETNTTVDVAVFHSPSRNLLFRGLGKSRITGYATPVNLTEALRKDSNEGFKEAAHMMIGNLQQQIELFKQSIK